MTVRYYHYQKKANRDRAYREERAARPDARIRRRSHRGVVLHPEYVVDWEGPVESGFGNSQYKTFFAVIYDLEITE